MFEASKGSCGIPGGPFEVQDGQGGSMEKSGGPREVLEAFWRDR